MSLKSLVLSVTLALAPGLAVAGDAKIKVLDPYARSASVNAKSGAIFLELMNHGEDDRLIAVSSPLAKNTQLHTHLEDANGVVKMRHVEDGFAIAAGERLLLERGGKHVMLLGLTEPLEDGASVPLTLTFEKAGEVTLDVIVDRDRKPEHGGDHGEHGHGHKHEDHSG